MDELNSSGPASSQMSAQIRLVDLAAEARQLGGTPLDQPGAAQPVKAGWVCARVALQDAPHHLHQIGILGQENEDTPKMVAEDPFIAGRVLHEFREPGGTIGKFVESPANEIRLPSGQGEELFPCGG